VAARLRDARRSPSDSAEVLGRRRPGRARTRFDRRSRIGPLRRRLWNRRDSPASGAARRQTAAVGARVSCRSSSPRRRSVCLTARMIAPARVAAYDILKAIAYGGADLPTAIAAARLTLEDDRDRALAAEIATGVQRHRAALDHLIAAFSRRAID